MKKIISICLLMLLFNHVFSQDNRNKLYLLADTMQMNTTSPNLKKLEIKWTTPFHYSFIFSSSYKAPYYNYLEFSSWVDKKNPKATIEMTKPCFKYITTKELLNLVKENFKYFNDTYDLYIVEVLPGNKYQTYRVKLMPQYGPTSDSVILKDN